MSISPGINVRPPPTIVLAPALELTAIGSFEIFSIVFPRMSTFTLALNDSLLPSKIRTFSNSMSDGSTNWG